MQNKNIFFTCLILLGTTGNPVGASTLSTPVEALVCAPIPEPGGGVILIDIDDVIFRVVDASPADEVTLTNYTNRTCTVIETCGETEVFSGQLLPGESVTRYECNGSPRTIQVLFD